MRLVKKSTKSILTAALFSSAIVLITSCKKDKKETPDPKTSIQMVTVKDLAADPIERSLETGETLGHLIEAQKNHYTLYRLSDSTIVPNSDSTQGKWDIGFHQTDIILNSSINGPGNVKGQVASGSFKALTEAPEEGYQTDNSNENIFSGWWGYNPSTHTIPAKEDYILVIQTHDGKYAKLEITSFYEGAPDKPTMKDQTGFYNFHYVYQPDGSRNLDPSEKE